METIAFHNAFFHSFHFWWMRMLCDGCFRSNDEERRSEKEARTQINIGKKGKYSTYCCWCCWYWCAAIAMLNLYYLINSMIFSSAGGFVRIHSTCTPWHFNLKINCFSLGRTETWPIYSMCAFHTTARMYLCIWTGAFYRRRIYVDIVVRRFKSNKLMVHTETARHCEHKRPKDIYRHIWRRHLGY